MRFPKKSAALRFFLAFFDRCAIKTSLYLPQAALRFSARHATALPRCPSYAYNQNRTTHLCKKIPYKSIKVRKGISLRVEKFRTLIARPIIKLSIHRQPLLRFPKKSAALRFSLAFFDRCAIKTSLYLPQAALRFSVRHATALPRCPSYAYNQNRTTHLCKKIPYKSIKVRKGISLLRNPSCGSRKNLRRFASSLLFSTAAP